MTRVGNLPSYDIESPCQNASSLLNWSSAASDRLSIRLAVHVAVAIHDRAAGLGHDNEIDRRALRSGRLMMKDVEER